jgi:hypothetical protein
VFTGSIGIGASPPTYPLRAYRAVAEDVEFNVRAYTIDYQMTDAFSSGFAVQKANPYNDVSYDTDGVYRVGQNTAYNRFGYTIGGFNSLLTSNASGTVPGIGSRKVNLTLGKNAENNARLYYSYNADDEHFASMSVVRGAVEVNRFVVGTTRSYIEGGNFGIGTTAPTEKLHVVGNVTTTGTINGSSDDRIKSDEVFITNATATLLKLRPQTYNKWSAMDYASDSNATSFKESGLIAQEVFYDAPELRHLVTLPSGADSNALYSSSIASSQDPSIDPSYAEWGTGIASVNYIGVIPYLIKALQEKDIEVQQTKQTLQDVLARLSALENA